MNVKKLLTGATLLMSPALLAHAGHDHSAITAGLIHSVAIISVIGVAAIAYKIFTAKKAVKQNINNK